MQIILFGQPELDQNLSQQSIRQLRERITHNFELEPLTQDEIHNYLNFRMRQVGYTGPELINSNVAKKIELHSEGLLRRINIIADKILLSAFAEGTHNLSSKHVSAAVNDSAFNQEAPRKSSMLWWMLLPLAIALAFALYQTRSQWLAMASVVTQPAPMAMEQAMQTPAADSDQMGSEPADTSGAVELTGETDQLAAMVEPVYIDPGLSDAELAAEDPQAEEMDSPATPVSTLPEVQDSPPVDAGSAQGEASMQADVEEIETATRQESMVADTAAPSDLAMLAPEPAPTDQPAAQKIDTSEALAANMKASADAESGQNSEMTTSSGWVKSSNKAACGWIAASVENCQFRS